MILRKNISILLFLFFTGVSVNAQVSESEAVGHDSARKKIAAAVNLSDELVEKKVAKLDEIIRTSEYPGDPEHNVLTAGNLASEHQQWLLYRESHCWLTSSVYIYPVGSKMSVSEYNSCKLDMNNSRIKFLNDIHYEYCGK